MKPEDIEILVCAMREDSEGGAGLVDSNPDDKGEPDFYDILVKELPNEEGNHNPEPLLELEDLNAGKMSMMVGILSKLLGVEPDYI